MLKHVAAGIEPEMLPRHLVKPFNPTGGIQQDHPVRRCLQRSQEVLQLGLTVRHSAFPSAKLASGTVRHLSPKTVTQTDLGGLAVLQPTHQAHAACCIHQQPDEATSNRAGKQAPLRSNDRRQPIAPKAAHHLQQQERQSTKKHPLTVTRRQTLALSAEIAGETTGTAGLAVRR